MFVRQLLNFWLILVFKRFIICNIRLCCCFKLLTIISLTIFGPKRDEVTGEWRTLHNEELHDLYSSPNIVRVIRSRGMRWAGHVPLLG